jgi:hypothetical protein
MDMSHLEPARPSGLPDKAVQDLADALRGLHEQAPSTSRLAGNFSTPQVAHPDEYWTPLGGELSARQSRLARAPQIQQPLQFGSTGQAERIGQATKSIADQAKEHKEQQENQRLRNDLQKALNQRQGPQQETRPASQPVDAQAPGTTLPNAPQRELPRQTGPVQNSPWVSRRTDSGLGVYGDQAGSRMKSLGVPQDDTFELDDPAYESDEGPRGGLLNTPTTILGNNGEIRHIPSINEMTSGAGLPSPGDMASRTRDYLGGHGLDYGGRPRIAPAQPPRSISSAPSFGNLGGQFGGVKGIESRAMSPRVDPARIGHPFGMMPVSDIADEMREGA